MEKVLHTFSIMISVPFIGPFSNDVTVVTQCSPMRSEFTRTHEELDFSYAVCDTEAKAERRPPQDPEGYLEYA